MTANEIYLAELRQEAMDRERAEQLMKSIAIPIRRKRPETVIYISTAPCDNRLRSEILCTMLKNQERSV